MLYRRCEKNSKIMTYGSFGAGEHPRPEASDITVDDFESSDFTLILKEGSDI
jgi:hypothetical protein